MTSKSPLSAQLLMEHLARPRPAFAPRASWDALLAVEALPLQPSLPVALSSPVISATAHPEGVLVVRMEDRASKNLFTAELIAGMHEVFRRARDHKVLVLTGYDQYFAAGGTQEALLAIQEGRAKFTDDDTYKLALLCEVPVIAAMQGHAIGGGLALGLFADFPILSAESKYVSPYMKYGFTPGAGATLIVPERFGAELGRETLLSAQEYSGQELQEKGLTLPVQPRKQVLAAALELASKLARHPREQLVEIKRQVTQSIRERLPENTERELAMHEQTFVRQATPLQHIQATYKQMDGNTTATLRRLLAQELHLEAHELDENSQFMDLGLDSITGVTWIRKINVEYGITLEATIVYSHPTLTKLAKHVEEVAGLTRARPEARALEGPLPTQPAIAPSQAAAEPAQFAIKELVSWRKKPAATAASVSLPASTRSDAHQPIAIIGMAGQFPQARNIEEFWRNIAEGKHCISEIPAKRWDLKTYFQEGAPTEGKTNCKYMGLLDDYDLFDPLFFNISPVEATAMDPQQRLFLQSCWQSIEHAGYNPKSLAGSKCGVFVGCATGDYQTLSQKVQLSAHGFTGGASSILAARISYFLDLQGPCISIDTACSSSLVAIANACDSLCSGVSDLALAGGVYVGAGPAMHIMTAQAGMLSTDGRCYTFDHRANGFVPGEAVGVVMLKRLDEALKDGDIIHAVIQGWGVNQDGRTNGITAPNPESQARLEQEVYRRYKIDPAEIQLIEAHGTGTALGDPIEIQGLTKSFKAYTQKKDYCALGSVKSNIGHCLLAAGVAGVIKAALALKHKQLPPTIHFEKLNEHIDLSDGPFYVNDRLQDWELKGASRRQAAISSFGYSGTNAHLVIAEPPAPLRAPVSSTGKVIIPLSAKTREQLKQRARDLLGFIQQVGAAAELVDVAYTLQVGREAMDERVGFLVSSSSELAEKLQAYVDGRQTIADFHQGQARVNKEGLSVISQDDELKDTIVEKWIAQKSFAKLLKLWVKGLELDWSKLYGEVKPRRIVLPTYPFAKERYWIESAAEPIAAERLATRSERLFFEEYWREEPSTAAAVSGVRVVTLTDPAELESIESEQPLSILYTGARGRKRAGIHSIFQLFKAIKASGRAVADVTLVGQYDPAQLDTCWDYSWIGFERSLKLILPNVKISILFTDSQAYAPEAPGSVVWRQGDRRFVLSLRSMAAAAMEQGPVLKQNGAYLITGGCGGLGFKFARFLAEKFHARLVLLGRRPLSSGIQEQLETLLQAGAQEARYAAVDISDRDALTTWATQLPFELSGIIHAAGIEASRPFHEKSAAEIDAVLSAKTTGTLLLGETLRAKDFVCYFSSSAAVLGDFGSCDYAVANRFQMAYAAYRAQRAELSGQTTVINWPFWEQGGMGFGGAEQTAFYLKSSGQEALTTEQGIEAWQEIMQAGMTQALVMVGNAQRIDHFLQRVYSAPRATARKPSASVKERVRADLRQLTISELKIAPGRLDDQTSLADYGFDSISLAAFAKRLTAHFSLEITPALFFSHATIQQLTDYFVSQHELHMEELYGPPPQAYVEEESPVYRSAAVQSARGAQAHAGAARPPAGGGTLQAEPIAIIGLSGRFPNARNADQLWSLLAGARSGITEVPPLRWNWREYRDQIRTNKGGFIDGVDEFDPLFFEISPREADEMDPAERVLLMEAYRAIEDARISPASLKGSNVGVFVGMEESQFSLITDQQGVTTAGGAMISSRLSYFLDLHGPTIATNTACSSGLVALHQAAMSLRQGECESALVAGLALSLSPKAWAKMCEAGMISEDGECFTFSKKANGIGIGEAVVVVMLKPLSAALANGDHIYGTLKASGINFDGKTNGVTAPNGRMQAKLIEDVYTRYGIDSRDVSHIVAHGTGTKLGDPVELNALDEAFRKLSRQKGKAHCAITSCKSNLGHTMAASGLVSLVALLKGLEHRQIPASLHCEDENDYISWRDSHFYINKATRDWPRNGDRPLLGAVSAFGRSGTNAHVVVEEFRNTEAVPQRTISKVLVPLSAKAPEQLVQKARDLLELIRKPVDLASLAYTLQIAREPMDERVAFIVSSLEQLTQKLEAYLHGDKIADDVFQGSASQRNDAMSVISDDDDMQAVISRWIAAGKLSKLAQVWAQGLNFDWDPLYADGEARPRKIGLPTYPFAKERCWIEAAAASAPAESAADLQSIEAILNQIDEGTLATQHAVSFLKRVV